MGLARAERALGADSTTAVFYRTWLQYPVDIDLKLSPRSRLARLPGRIRFAAKAIKSYDVFHFNFGQTLLPMLGPLGIDLPLLRRLGKRIFVTFQGGDARPVTNTDSADENTGTTHRLRRRLSEWARARRVAYLTRYAHKVFCVNPDLLRFVPGAEFVPYASVDPAQIEPSGASDRPRVTIAHAPTDRAVKGTEHVLAAAEKLDGKHEVDWMLVERVPHAEALRRLRTADLVIDQLRVGWYGGFAVEMMAMGKPVVCYIREADLRFVPPAMAAELPIVRATPENLTDVVADLLSDRERIHEIGRRARRYVERWHDPLRIARAMLAIYQNSDRGFWEVFEAGAGEPPGLGR
jgi:glycosyltransferase involved in cell wall biosynthesis